MERERGRIIERIGNDYLTARRREQLLAQQVAAQKAEVEKLRQFGRAVGVAFQIADDVLDVTQSSEQLGKTAGKDTAAEKATYPALFGVDESLKRADVLVNKALGSLETFGARAEILKSLACFLVERKK
jgi:geranylgeranyl diphosphate synthase type II